MVRCARKRGKTQTGGGSARVYSKLLVEENRKKVRGKIESRGVDRFFRLVASPEPKRNSRAQLVTAKAETNRECRLARV